MTNPLLNEIRQLEFVTLELNLYLDTHPCDRRALMQYNMLSQRLLWLKNCYEMQYGPLFNFGWSQSINDWNWINEPWPWEIGG